jgi:hypothetical protein
MLSLMRSHSDEHAEALPVLDVAAMRHVAYVFDALVYCMRSGNDVDGEMLRDGVSVQSWQDHEEMMTDDADDDLNQNVAAEADSDAESELGVRLGKKHRFFQRSDSTIFPGCASPDPFASSIYEALPLADKPQLLHPNARKEELFGMPKHAPPAHDGSGRGSSLFDTLPSRLSMSSYLVPGSSASVPPLRIPPSPPAPTLAPPLPTAPLVPTIFTTGLQQHAASVIVKPPTSQTAEQQTLSSGTHVTGSPHQGGSSAPHGSSSAHSMTPPAASQTGLLSCSQLRPVDMTIANMERQLLHTADIIVPNVSLTDSRLTQSPLLVLPDVHDHATDRFVGK